MNNKAKSIQKRKKQTQIANVKSTSISIIPNKTTLSVNNNNYTNTNNEHHTLCNKKDNDAKIDRLQFKISNIISLIDSFKKEYITAFDNDIKSKKESLHLNQTNTNTNTNHYVVNKNSFVCLNNNNNKERQLHCVNHKQRKSNSMMNNVKCATKDKRNTTIYKQLSSINSNRSNGKNNNNNNTVVNSVVSTKKFNGVKDNKNEDHKNKGIKGKKMFATVDVCLKNTLTRRTRMNNIQNQNQTQKSFNSFNTHIKYRNDNINNNIKNISSKTKAVPLCNFNKKLTHNSADKTKYHHKCKSERIENVFSYKKLF